MEQKQTPKFKSTPYFRLKDKEKKNFQAINLKKQFGFLPEVIIIEKLPGKRTILCIRAIMPESLKELKLEEAKK